MKDYLVRNAELNREFAQGRQVLLCGVPYKHQPWPICTRGHFRECLEQGRNGFLSSELACGNYEDYVLWDSDLLPESQPLWCGRLKHVGIRPKTGRYEPLPRDAKSSY